MSPHQLNSPWPGIIRIFPAWESLVSDIPARDWKIRKSGTFFTVYVVLRSVHLPGVLFRAAFVFDEGNNLGVSGKGQDFATFKSFFNPDNRGFGYIKVQVGKIRRFKYFFNTGLSNMGVQVESRDFETSKSKTVVTRECLRKGSKYIGLQNLGCKLYLTKSLKKILFGLRHFQVFR
jgi:hypothetical protein